MSPGVQKPPEETSLNHGGLDVFEDLWTYKADSFLLRDVSLERTLVVLESPQYQ